MTSDELRKRLEAAIERLGYELTDLEVRLSGKGGLVGLTIDKPDGINLEDCEKVSRQVSSLMDVEDPIGGEYTLEVSSPGLERPLYTLDQFLRYVGENVAIRLRFPYEGRRNFKGRLNGVEGEDILLIVEDHEYLFPVDSIEKANVVPHF